MDRYTAHSDWQNLSGRIKRRWNKLSDQELAQAEDHRDYLVAKVHERYGLARDEIDEELALLGVGSGGTAMGPTASQSHAKSDRVSPGSGLDDQGEAAGYEQARDASLADPELAESEDMRISSRNDPRGATERRNAPDPQEVLKDRGTATQSGGAAALDQPKHRGKERRLGSERRS